jgi:hypothetical protein
MRRTILIGLSLALLPGTATAAHGASSHDHAVNVCLRHHGWPFGLLALERAELQHGHPNGLIRICTERGRHQGAARSFGRHR